MRCMSTWLVDSIGRLMVWYRANETICTCVVVDEVGRVRL
jgi:hypothetical protein